MYVNFGYVARGFMRKRFNGGMIVGHLTIAFQRKIEITAKFMPS